MGKSDAMTQEEFDLILLEIAHEEGVSSIFTIPGIYEILSEHFNNHVLEVWEDRRRR